MSDPRSPPKPGGNGEASEADAAESDVEEATAQGTTDGRGSDASDCPTSIETLAAEADRARAASDPPSDPPDPDRALAAARNGLGPVVARYIRARTGERERLTMAQMDGLHRATNDWLAVYAHGYGVEVDPDVTVREAAELVVETHDIAATARLLTGVPAD